jgi:PPOX class probable F420-dependent enzyme
MDGVPRSPLPDDLVEFLAQPNPAVIGTVAPDGSPHTAATWYLREDDGRVLVNMAADRKRLDYMRQEPRVSISVMGSGDDWYHQVTLRGRAVEIADDADFDGIDRLSRRYTGEPYARREQKRVNAWIDVESWYGWATGQPWRG